MKHENNVRKAKVIRVLNGNTLDLEIDLGFGIKAIQRIDLARVAPADQFTDIGSKAKLKMNLMFHHVPDVTIQFDRHPDDSSRFIGEVWADTGQNLTDYLLEEGAATLDERFAINVLG